MWLIENKHSRNRLNVDFDTQEGAQGHLTEMGAVFSREYRLVHDSGNDFIDRILTEGLEQGDMFRILLPRISVDEYVPADPETENIVVAFYIKGVPEAVVPFKNFCDKCNGVLEVDYGDSDTVLNTSVVYVEFDRENLDMEDIDELLGQVSMIAALDKEDFTMTFPHTNKKFPYNLRLLGRYFQSRNRRKNLLAQKKAEKRAQAELDRQLRRGNQSMRQADAEEQEDDQEAQQTQAQAQEATVNALVNKFLVG